MIPVHQIPAKETAAIIADMAAIVAKVRALVDLNSSSDPSSNWQFTASASVQALTRVFAEDKDFGAMTMPAMGVAIGALLATIEDPGLRAVQYQLLLANLNASLAQMSLIHQPEGNA